MHSISWNAPNNPAKKPPFLQTKDMKVSFVQVHRKTQFWILAKLTFMYKSEVPEPRGLGLSLALVTISGFFTSMASHASEVT